MYKGSCFCGSVSYQFSESIGTFQYCHCSRCRKLTGSAFAANLFVQPHAFSWLSGEELIGQYVPEHTRYFTTSFCRNCGSTLPWMPKGNKVVIVPAGTLDDDPQIRPIQQLHCASAAPWFVPTEQLPAHDAMPPRKS